MNIEDLTISQAREIAAMFPTSGALVVDKGPWVTGAAYFIRTVTHHLTGRLISVSDQELLISDAAWIADDGRFSQAVEKGQFNEVEPFPDGKHVIIGRGSVIDAVQIGSTPRSQK